MLQHNAAQGCRAQASAETRATAGRNWLTRDCADRQCCRCRLCACVPAACEADGSIPIETTKCYVVCSLLDRTSAKVRCEAIGLIQMKSERRAKGTLAR